MISPLPAAVTVRVLLFATYADMTGQEAVEFTLPEPVTVGDVIRRLRASLPGAEQIPERPLAAVNRVQADLDAVVSDGDEVALLPPLAGG